MVNSRLKEFAHRYGLFLGLIAGPLALVGWRLAIGQVLFWGTPALQFVPWWMAAWRQLAQGSLPLWNPDLGLGAPLLANYQTAFFYPPNWTLTILAAVFGAPGVAWGYTFLAMLHLFWAGWGMARLVARYGAGNLAQLVAGLAFSLSGYLVARLEFISMIWCAAWLPWILVYTDELCGIKGPSRKEKTIRLSLPLVLCVGLQLLAGHAQLSWYTLQLAGVWALVSTFIRNRWQFWKPFSGFVLSLAAGALLASIQLLPTAEYLLQSQRASQVSYTEAMVYSFWPWRLITLFAPDFFGNPGNGDFWGYASYWEDAAYIGLAPLLLALTTFTGLFKRPHSDREEVRKKALIGFWVLIPVAVLLAMGQNTPIFPFLYRSVPTFSMFQAPARYMLWVVLGLAFLAAQGVERWRCPTGRGLYWLRLGTAGAFAISLGAGLAWINLRGVNLTFIRATALAGLWALGTGGLTLLLPVFEKRGSLTLWKGGVAAWILLDLLVAGWSLNPMVPVAFYQGKSDNAQKLENILYGGSVYMPAEVESRLKFKRFFRFQDTLAIEKWDNLRAAYLPNLTLLDGIPSLNNFDPILPGRYVRWINMLESASPIARQELMRQAGVGAVETIDVREVGGVHFEPIPAAPRFEIFDCPTWMKNEEDVLAALKKVRPGKSVLFLEGTSLQTNCLASAPGSIQVLTYKPDQIRLQTVSEKPSWALIRIHLYPGWQASLDGKPLVLYHANGLFMGFEIPAGDHQISLQYRPGSFYLGAMLSILILVGIGYLSLAPVARAGWSKNHTRNFERRD